MIRIASGVVLASGFLALVLFGTPDHFFIFIELVILISLFEMYGMFKAGSAPCLKLTGAVSGVALGAILYIGDQSQIVAMTGTALLVIVIGSLSSMDKEAMVTASNTIFGLMFVTVPLTALALLRSGDGGAILVIMIVTANAFGDTFAYYTGRSIGKTPLAPRISPGKTVEGLIGGVAGSIIGAIGIKLLFAPWLGMPHAIAAGLLAGLLGPLGDLAESSIKRKMGVKDSGWIIPGHGGVLDRVDSLMFSGASFYIYTVLFMVP